jgi:mRNA-degrading endonuclease RelE of RelBE toxin-antitoxin system
MVWILHFDKEAQRQLKKLAKSPDKPLYDKGLRELQYSTNPRDLGTYKENLACYSYRINKPMRILYSVFDDQYAIVVHHLGGHKQVYGKD